ncbi:hypothetical protein BRADI_1g07655v3 [Brachypodium distachyon]|uniref:Uncharacterized protein n=1 Tax=Brachypodium distachyon TaxID=15368 RepID=A0A2K2DII0_BRADI|nr:hypothetical protein BRADI_1g07655v3 [Brachypodium distachyon]
MPLRGCRGRRMCLMGVCRHERPRRRRMCLIRNFSICAFVPVPCHCCRDVDCDY